MMVFLFAIAFWAVFGFDETKIAERNAKLRRTNQVLFNALQELSVGSNGINEEAAVAEETAVGQIPLPDGNLRYAKANEKDVGQIPFPDGNLRYAKESKVGAADPSYEIERRVKEIISEHMNGTPRGYDDLDNHLNFKDDLGADDEIINDIVNSLQAEWYNKDYSLDEISRIATIQDAINLVENSPRVPCEDLSRTDCDTEADCYWGHTMHGAYYFWACNPHYEIIYDDPDKAAAAESQTYEIVGFGINHAIILFAIIGALSLVYQGAKVACKIFDSTPELTRIVEEC